VFVVSRVGSNLCDGLITHFQRSSSGCVCLIVCELTTSTVRQPKSNLDCCATEKNTEKNQEKFLGSCYLRTRFLVSKSDAEAELIFFSVIVE
jgi:hypothetical protein